MTEYEILLLAEAAQRLGVATRVIIEAMYDQTLRRVKLSDGRLGIPAEALTPLSPRSWRSRSRKEVPGSSQDQTAARHV